MSLSGKVAIVTGGGSGIGRIVSLRLAELGVKVVVADINKENGNSVVDAIRSKGGDSYFVQCDVTKDLDSLFHSAWDKYGRLDIVCNNAGIAGESDITNTLDFKYTKILDIDLTAVIRGTQLAIHYIKKSGRGGVIVNTASLAGLVPQSFQPVYAAAKGGVVHFTRSLAHLEKTANIRVVAICPGFTETPLTDPIRDFIKTTFKENMITADFVTEGFIELITDKHNKGGGAVMRVTDKLGRDYPNVHNRKSAL